MTLIIYYYNLSFQEAMLGNDNPRVFMLFRTASLPLASSHSYASGCIKGGD